MPRLIATFDVPEGVRPGELETMLRTLGVPNDRMTVEHIPDPETTRDGRPCCPKCGSEDPTEWFLIEDMPALWSIHTQTDDGVVADDFYDEVPESSYNMRFECNAERPDGRGGSRHCGQPFTIPPGVSIEYAPDPGDARTPATRELTYTLEEP